ncbi:MAG: hypothetical protein HY681_08470 [Chloroflexi bacterium]|nr:hypothetical protein [Chloroflexota bacterium]
MPTIVDTAINPSPALKAAYEALLGKLVSLGPIIVEPKKTSVHLKARVAFVGVHARKDCLIVQVVAEGPIASGGCSRRSRCPETGIITTCE